MRLPDFLVIGAAKSGTTTLYEYLCRHPQIFMSTPKEPEFFARDEMYAKGLDWYASLFQSAKPNQICGEASTKYTRYPEYPEAAPRIAEALPNVKLIYLMRHPVDRAYSYYVQRIKTAQNTKVQLEVTETFEESIARDPRFLESSDYLLQIEQYLKVFPRESMLLLMMEDLTLKPAETLQQICRFIGVDDQVDLIQSQPVAVNVARTHEEWFLRSRITAPLRAVPGISAAAALLPQSARDRAYRMLKKLPQSQQVAQKYVPAKMKPETRVALLAKYEPLNQKLAEFLDRDLSHWSQ